MTKEQFLPVFNRLCVALREPVDDSGVTQSVYYEALQDLEGELLQAGAAKLMTEPGRRFFPTSAEWRTASNHAARDRSRALALPGRTEPWRHECASCHDTGWIQHLECDGGSICGRTRPHAPHSYTDVCGCRATNRTYQRHLAARLGAA